MAVYLDIDADFLFYPRNNGNPRGKEGTMWLAPDGLVKRLEKAGLRWSSSPVFLFTDHKEAYFVWAEAGVWSETLVHVDAHSDLYDSFSWMIHCGNFLRKTAETGRFSKIIWVMPMWLYQSGDWQKYDLPGCREQSSLACEGSDKNEKYPEVSRVHLLNRKVTVEVVPLNWFRLPVTHIKMVTLATSPLFVPSHGYAAVKDLVSDILTDCADFYVRPDIPLCLKDPVLRKDLPDQGRNGAGKCPLLDLGYLWSEHKRLEELEEIRGKNIVA